MLTYEEGIARIDRFLAAHLNGAAELADRIHAHPELGEQEFETSRLLAERLREGGFQVEAPTCGLPTAFQGVARHGSGPVVALLTEMDALPEIGHACGHNLHGVMSVLAGLALKECLPDLEGQIRVVGTPAEETNGAKVSMAAAGIFDDCDLALMIHCNAGESFVDYRSLAMDSVEFTFTGKPAHAAGSPWEGLNALNGVQLLFHGVDMLRQHVRPETRMHGIISAGGVAPNIVPETAQARFYFRAPWRPYLNQLMEKVYDCARGAALATGTQVTWRNNEASFDDMLPNPTAENLIGGILVDLGVSLVPGPGPMGSTDVGNVSYRCPALQPELAITPERMSLHTREFEAALLLPEAHRMLGVGAQALARTCLKVFLDPELRASLRRDFETQKNKMPR